jgi:hypothetical protein
MEDSLHLLILLLHRVNNDELIDVINGHYLSGHPLVSAIIFLANECLIGDDGHIIRDNIDEVIRAGFPIRPGEMDRYGWLTGIIELSRGMIMFG